MKRTPLFVAAVIVLLALLVGALSACGGDPATGDPHTTPETTTTTSTTTAAPTPTTTTVPWNQTSTTKPTPITPRSAPTVATLARVAPGPGSATEDALTDHGLTVLYRTGQTPFTADETRRLLPDTYESLRRSARAMGIANCRAMDQGVPRSVLEVSQYDNMASSGFTRADVSESMGLQIAAYCPENG